MLAYWQLDSWEHISVKFESRFYHFHSRKCYWKCRLPKWRPFCSRGDELNICLVERNSDIWVKACCLTRLGSAAKWRRLMSLQPHTRNPYVTHWSNRIYCFMNTDWNCRHHCHEICPSLSVSRGQFWYIYVYIYIHIYIKWTVFFNVTTKSAQHAHARMIAIIVEKSPNSSHMYDHGFMDNTNRQAVKNWLDSQTRDPSLTSWRQPFWKI